MSAAQQLVERIDADLRQRVSVRIGTRVAQAMRASEEVHRAAREPAADPAQVWAEVHALRSEVDTLLEECLVLVAGSAQRSMKLDDGFCALADALVDELVARTPIGHWSSFTVLGRADFYSRASRAIEVRFPAPTIWDLPIVAHELGHFIGPALTEDVGRRTEHPLDALFENVGDGTERCWSWLQELAADACAAYLLGPAYGFTCVLTGFDPLLALMPSETHPPAQQRVQTVAAVLKHTPETAWAAQHLLGLWDGVVTAAGGADGREPLDPSPFTDPLVQMLDACLPVSAYRTWDVADRVAPRLTERAEAAVAGPRPALADILNAAWLARLRSPSLAAADGAGQAALALIQKSIAEVP